MSGIKAIDTLFLSSLLFPAKPYHALLKDDKLQTDELNNPLNDAIKAKDLFYDEISAFHELDNDLKQIYYALLRMKKSLKHSLILLTIRSMFSVLHNLYRIDFWELFA